MHILLYIQRERGRCSSSGGLVNGKMQRIIFSKSRAVLNCQWAGADLNIYIYHQYNDQHVCYISFKLFISNRFIIISPVLSKILVELAPKFQASQIVWQRHLCETLNEAITESQALQSAWQGHSFQALVKPVASFLDPAAKSSRNSYPI